MAANIEICHVKGDQFLFDKKRIKIDRKCPICRSGDHQTKCCPRVKCYFCGRKGHTQKLCWFKHSNKLENYKRNMRRYLEERVKYVQKKISFPPMFGQSMFGSSGSEKRVVKEEEFIIPSESSYRNYELEVSNFNFGVVPSIPELCVSRSMDLTLGGVNDSKVLTKDTELKKITKINNNEINEKGVKQEQENLKHEQDQLVLDRDKTFLERLQYFGPIAEFSVTCSPLEKNIMINRIKKHFVLITVESYNHVNTVRSMFGMKIIEDKEVLDSFNSEVEYAEVIGSIVMDTGCNVYVFMVNSGKEIKVTPMNKKCYKGFNLFCLFDSHGLQALIPKNDRLIGDVKRREKEGIKFCPPGYS